MGPFGVSWYGMDASIAQTGFQFTADEARTVARLGAEATDFWAWADAQPFEVDELTDGTALPVMRADAENETQDSDEFTAWVRP